MSYRWSVVESAVESKIFFPDVDCYSEYISKLRANNRSFEVLSVDVCKTDGSITAVIRKEYNNNIFKRSDNDNLVDSHYRVRASKDFDLDYIYKVLKETNHQ